MVRSAATAILLAITCFGQTFEVASVKRNISGARGGSMDFPPGGERFTATNMQFGALVLAAYGITVRQLSGAGEFLSDKYDVAAKAEHPAGPDEMLRMLQALLVERFKLTIRRETKEVPVYALTVGTGGPKLHPSDTPAGERSAILNPSLAMGTEGGAGHLIYRNESMPDFAWALTRVSGIGDRVVVDQTGLTGTYDFELVFGRGADPEAPSIFSALQEQLGLKLESKRAPVKFLIIDHVEKPAEN